MKHGLILGEPYQLEDATYIAGHVGGAGQPAGDLVVLLYVVDPEDPAEAGDLAYHIDDAGRIWSIDDDPERSFAFATGIWRGLGLVLIPTDWTVADLVAVGLDPEVWGNL